MTMGDVLHLDLSSFEEKLNLRTRHARVSTEILRAVGIMFVVTAMSMGLDNLGFTEASIVIVVPETIPTPSGPAPTRVSRDYVGSAGGADASKVSPDSDTLTWDTSVACVSVRVSSHARLSRPPSLAGMTALSSTSA